MSTVQGPTVIFGAEFPGLAQGAGEFDKIRKGAERARDQFGRFIKVGSQAAPALRKAGEGAAQGLGAATNAAEEAVKALAEIPPTLDDMLKSIDKTNDGFEDFGSGFNKKADEIGRKLDKSTEGMERLRQQVDQTVDPLRLFGKRGIDLANAIDDIPDPARRSALALKLLKEQVNPGFIEKVNRKWANFNSELELLKVRAGVLLPAFSAVASGIGTVIRAAMAAAAAIAVGVVGGLTAAFTLALEGNKKLKKSFDELERSGKKLVSAAAQIFIGLAGIDTAATDATKSLDGMTTALIKNQSEFRIYAALVIELASDVGQFIANMGMVIRIALFDIPRLAYRVLQALVDRLPEMFHNLRASIMTSMAGIILDMALMAKKLGADDLAKKLRDVWEGARDAAIQAEQDAKQYGKGVTSTFTVIKGELDELVETLETIDSFGERGRTLAQKIRLGNVGDIKVDTTGLDEKEKEKKKRKGGGAMTFMGAISTEPLKAAEALADFNYEIAGGIQLGNNYVKALEGIDFAAARLADQGMQLLIDSLGEVVNSMVELGSMTATTLGEFAAGVGTLSEFGDAVLDQFGALASSIGDFFIKTGMASLWLNPAAGAGMIAGGLALKALSGFLSAKGSGNRGSGRGSSSSGGASVDPSRFLRPERSVEPSVTNLKVVILGEEIEKPVTRFMDDVARRGGFRNLATRT